MKEKGKFTSIPFLDFLKKLADGWYVFIVKIWCKRSELQNNYYRWVVLKTIADETWYEDTELHAIFGNMFLRTDIDDPYFWQYPKIQSTTELTTTEMMWYIDNITKHSAEQLQISIPPPDPLLYPPKYKRHNG